MNGALALLPFQNESLFQNIPRVPAHKNREFARLDSVLHFPIIKLQVVAGQSERDLTRFTGLQFNLPKSLELLYGSTGIFIIYCPPTDNKLLTATEPNCQSGLQCRVLPRAAQGVIRPKMPSPFLTLRQSIYTDVFKSQAKIHSDIDRTVPPDSW